MPQRPLRPCKHAGCPAVTTDGYCYAHAGRSRTHDRWRGTASSRGYDAHWQRLRIAALKRDKYLCVLCLTHGRVTPAVDVDHITPIKVDETQRLDLDNLQSLCRSCHREKTLAEQGRYQPGYNTRRS